MAHAAEGEATAVGGPVWREASVSESALIP